MLRLTLPRLILLLILFGWVLAAWDLYRGKLEYWLQCVLFLVVTIQLLPEWVKDWRE